METRTIVGFTATTGRFSLFSRFSWIPRRGRDALIPIAIRSRGNEYRCNCGTDAGSMLFRCTRFFLVEWKYPTIFFSSLLFTFLFSLSLSRFSVGRCVGTKHRRERELEGEERRGEKNMARVLRRSNFSLHFFCPPVGEGGIADRVECWPLQMRFVGVETRALWQKIEHSNPTLSSFACHFWQETVRGLKANKIHERKTREECEERKKGRGKREGGKSRIN